MDQPISNKEMAESIFTAMNTRDFSHVQEYLSEDVVFDFPGSGRMEGKKKVLVFLKALLRNYSELIFHVSDIIIEGDRACVVWSNKGEHKDGTLYENQGITLVHFLENQIVFLSDYFKDTSFANNS